MSKQKDFDMNLLRVFVSVCQTGSFTKAAEELELTQSSVSNAIRRLKSALGNELFIRSGRGIEVTAYGENLFKQVEPSVMALVNAVDDGDRFDPQSTKRTFVIYALESVLPQLQIRLRELLKNTTIKVTLKELPSSDIEIIDALMLERVDLVLDVVKPRQASLQSMIVSEDKICCIARVGHPRVDKSLDADMFFKEEHAFLNMRRFKQTMTDYLSEEVLPNRKMGSEHTSMLGMMACIAQSDLIGINSVRLVSQYQHSFKLQKLVAPFSTRPIKTHMIWPTKFENNKANQWLRQLIIAAEKS